MKKNILITGGLGLLGKPLVKFLSLKKYKIFVLDKSKNEKRNKLIKKLPKGKEKFKSKSEIKNF